MFYINDDLPTLLLYNLYNGQTSRCLPFLVSDLRSGSMEEKSIGGGVESRQEKNIIVADLNLLEAKLILVILLGLQWAGEKSTENLFSRHRKVGWIL